MNISSPRHKHPYNFLIFICIINSKLPPPRGPIYKCEFWLLASLPYVKELILKDLKFGHGDFRVLESSVSHVQTCVKTLADVFFAGFWFQEGLSVEHTCVLYGRSATEVLRVEVVGKESKSGVNIWTVVKFKRWKGFEYLTILDSCWCNRLIQHDQVSLQKETSRFLFKSNLFHLLSILLNPCNQCISDYHHLVLLIKIL